ncbi:MAG: hypothetical protein ACI8QZ_002917 [Chlamydiales bacterium]|jgi:hypothetical protein
MRLLLALTTSGLVSLLTPAGVAQAPPGEGPALGPNRILQSDIATGVLDYTEVRQEGLRIFTTSFNKHDGFGDGLVDPMNPDKTSPGNRPSLQNNGTWLRVNGLDSQTCLECHGIVSNATIPAILGVGGVGGIGASAMPGATELDIDDSDDNGFANYNGRLINPPFIFGAGGVELVAKEMTAALQVHKQTAANNPNVLVPLIAKGVDFGSISFDGVDFDTSLVEGVDPSLVVAPFGRKGNNSTVRAFDLGAMAFHHGMQPEELTDDMDGDGAPDPGVDNDPDGDGVFNELTVGEISALHIFSTSLEHPIVRGGHTAQANAGRQLFNSIGCTDCHVSSLTTDTRILPIQFPELATDPFNPSNVFFEIDLGGMPNRFPVAGNGVRVPMFSDLKRHDMGPALAESTGSPLAPFFITARLWGIADTAPYLHDGRALTLTEAIDQHGGEGTAAAAAFGNLSAQQKVNLLTFLRSLKTPRLIGTGLQMAG